MKGWDLSVFSLIFHLNLSLVTVTSMIQFTQISNALINCLEGLGRNVNLVPYSRGGLFGHFIHCTFFQPHVEPPLHMYLISPIIETFWGSVAGNCLLLFGRYAGYNSCKSDRTPSKVFHFLFSLSLWVYDFLFFLCCFCDFSERVKT